MNLNTIIIWVFLFPTANLDSFLSGSDAFFKKYVSNGSVNYELIHKNPKEIDLLYSYIGDADLGDLTDEEKKAFYINAYNLIVIYQVSKYYPLKSPLDASGFFDKVKHKVAGQMMTLNALEIKKLLMTYKDARIHFVLACAAKSCPELASFAYKPDILDKQLEERTQKSINDSDWLKVNNSSRTVEISKIFKWYKKDFEADHGSIRTFINEYRNNKIPGNYSFSYYEYNWALNDQ